MYVVKQRVLPLEEHRIPKQSLPPAKSPGGKVWRWRIAMAGVGFFVGVMAAPVIFASQFAESRPTGTAPAPMRKAGRFYDMAMLLPPDIPYPLFIPEYLGVHDNSAVTVWGSPAGIEVTVRGDRGPVKWTITPDGAVDATSYPAGKPVRINGHSGVLFEGQRGIMLIWSDGVRRYGLSAQVESYELIRMAESLR